MKSPVEVKICGLTSEADAGLLEKYGADYGGMVLFYPKSKRNISLELAGLLVRRLKKSDIKRKRFLLLMLEQVQDFRLYR